MEWNRESDMTNLVRNKDMGLNRIRRLITTRNHLLRRESFLRTYKATIPLKQWIAY
jgi:hypothetical protein